MKKIENAATHIGSSYHEGNVDIGDVDIGDVTLPPLAVDIGAVQAKLDIGTECVTAPGYAGLGRVLDLAFNQSATGKGRQRHGTGPVGPRAWEEQPIMTIGRMVGPGYAAGQVAKKVQESVTMQGNGNYAGAKAEALGAIVYAAALYKLYEEMEMAYHSR